MPFIDHPELAAIRDRLDAVDRDLVRVLAARATLITEVVHFKRAHGMPVVDRAREDEMLDRIERTASDAGLDPRIARQVLRAVIDAFTLLEVEQLGPDPEHP
jgi:chorismate mutase